MTQHYGLGTFAKAAGAANGGAPCAGLVIDGRIASLADLAEGRSIGSAPAGASVLTILEEWETARPALDRLAARVGEDARFDQYFHALETVRVYPPVNLPRQIFCTGANYRQHVIDMTLDMGVGPEGLDKTAMRAWAEKMMDDRAATGEPYVFVKPISAVSGAYDDLVLPDNTAKPDWELELAVIIGREGFHVTRQNALEHVAGYTIANDISARDLIARTDYKMLGTDWLRAKGQSGFLPLGPFIVPAHLIADPMNLKLRLSVNGKVMQNESTSDMLFGIARQIEYISSYVRLLPGDVICTGSPAGNGTHYGRFLQDGDTMVGEIEGLGAQHVKCIKQ